MATSAPCKKDGSPIVSPVEFYNDGFSLYIFPQPNSPKVHALRRDPRLSFAIANPMAGWACVMGAQLFGKGTLLDVDTPEWEHGMKVFKWVASGFELGKISMKPPRGQLLRIDPDRIVYTEHFMRTEGYAPRQIWTPAGDSPRWFRAATLRTSAPTAQEPGYGSSTRNAQNGTPRPLQLADASLRILMSVSKSSSPAARKSPVFSTTSR